MGSRPGLRYHPCRLPRQSGEHLCCLTPRPSSSRKPQSQRTACTCLHFEDWSKAVGCVLCVVGPELESHLAAVPRRPTEPPPHQPTVGGMQPHTYRLIMG